jgi:hypothetical protein
MQITSDQNSINRFMGSKPSHQTRNLQAQPVAGKAVQRIDITV